MKYTSWFVLSLLVLFMATSVGSQEVRRNSDNSREQQEEGVVTGAFNHVAEEQRQVVVDDRIFALGETVWVDGTNYPIDEVDGLLDNSEKVKLELSRDQRHGHRLVIRIRTNP